MLSGWKTYAAAAVGVLVAGLKAQGHIEEATANVLLELAGFLGLAALRAGVKKTE